VSPDIICWSALSADFWTCIPCRALNGHGDRCFAAASPSFCNSLPLQLPDISFNHFKTIEDSFVLGDGITALFD